MSAELSVNATYEGAGDEREPWQRHAWDESHKWCVECHHEWPCDIAKAISYGIGLGQIQERYRRA